MAVQTIFVISDKPELLAELCMGARALATRVEAITFGDEQTANAAAACGADKLLYAKLDDQTSPEDYAKALNDYIRAQSSAFVFVANTIRGRCLAGMLGALLDTAVLTTVGELTAQDDTLLCNRMVYGGTAQSSVVFTAPYAVVTLGSGVFGDVTPQPAAGEIAELPGAATSTVKRISRDKKRETTTNLAVAKRIVDVGRGLAAEEDLEMVRKLASVLEAEVGCSRPVAENNKWMPKACYMGITGVQVKPDLILVLGVSGQVQHIGGINKSKVIVAVNKDKEAPIFKNADFGVVGDIYKVVPALIEQLS